MTRLRARAASTTTATDALIAALTCAFMGAASAAAPLATHAAPPPALSMPSFLTSDHMLLQRAPTGAVLWGWATASARVNVTVTDAASGIILASAACAAADGAPHKWTTPVIAVAAQVNTTVTVATAGATITVRDVAWGDLYLASGQSNMQYPVADAINGDAERNASTFPTLRLLTFKDTDASAPATDCPSQAPYVWARTTPEAIAPRDTTHGFADPYPSAVAFFAARDLMLALRADGAGDSDNASVPIGLVTAAWSGSAIEHWMPPAMIIDGTPEALGGNGTCGGTRPPPAHPHARDNATCPGGGLDASGRMFYGMIAPLAEGPMRLTGVQWYQGEENDHANDPCPGPQWYSCLFPAMIQGWRQAFASPALPFHYVLLAGGHTAVMREAQRSAQQLQHTYFASALDVSANASEEIIPGHPPRKQEVGRRLSLVARALIYGDSSVDYRGPYVVVDTVVANVTADGGVTMSIGFDVGSLGGLHLNGTAACTECCGGSSGDSGGGGRGTRGSGPGSPVAIVDPDATASMNPVLAATFEVVNAATGDGTGRGGRSTGGTPTLVATVDASAGFKSSRGRVQVQFQYSNYPQCVLYNGGVGAGPDSHTGIVAETWRGNVTLHGWHGA